MADHRDQRCHTQLHIFMVKEYESLRRTCQHLVYLRMCGEYRISQEALHVSSPLPHPHNPCQRKGENILHAKVTLTPLRIHIERTYLINQSINQSKSGPVLQSHISSLPTFTPPQPQFSSRPIFAISLLLFRMRMEQLPVTTP